MEENKKTNYSINEIEVIRIYIDRYLTKKITIRVSVL